MIDPTASESNSLYFAYGSNLNLSDLDDWSCRNGFEPAFLSFLTTAWLSDFETCFTVFSEARSGGVLDIREAAAQRTPGALFRVTSPHGWATLDQKENVPTRYERVQVSIETDGGYSRSATSYRVRADQRSEFVDPSDAYVKIVCQGLAHWGLDHKHIFAAQQRGLL